MNSLPALMDWTQLGLVVRNVQFTTSISDGEMSVTASPGVNLVVVTLAGRSPRPCYVAADSREFGAIYEPPPQAPGSPPTPQVQTVQAAGVGFTDEPWIFNIPQRSVTFVRYFPTPGPIAFRMAVAFPTHVTAFSIRYPAAVEAAIPTVGRN